ncbi:dipeptidase 1-like [Ptychodera flava]|uniref:dipeptidase 1-like n=1 Tax=Ptychodera flava TaxID=63121 RepID=UPI003969CDE8
MHSDKGDLLSSSDAPTPDYSSIGMTTYARLPKQRRNRYIVIGAVVAILAVVLSVAIAVPLSRKSTATEPTWEEYLAQAKEIMQRVPLVDGHNDFPWQVRKYWQNQLSLFDMHSDLSDYTHTDIPRLREGHVGAQFWAAYMPCGSQYKDAVRQTLDQIDVIKRISRKYSDTFDFVTTAKGILDTHAAGKIGSLIGVEGGHSIDSSLGTLRVMYEVGVRYMTITHNCNTPWADNCLMTQQNTSEHNGLTEWGKTVIKEMNRLGMLVDLSHVSFKTMVDTLDVTEAPIIFSHSSAYAECNHHRNVPDYILEKTKQNNGIVMVTFVGSFINCPPNQLDRPELSQVADHIDHIADTIGHDFVGIGGDYDGMSNVPVGLEDASTYPNLVAELLSRGWSEENLEKLIGLNLVRVFEDVEKVRDSMIDIPPFDDILPVEDSESEANNTCRYR